MTADTPAATTTPAATISSLDHLVLTVKSIPATTKWYEQNLGMKHESFTSASSPEIRRHSLIFGDQKINLHEAGKEFEPKAHTALPGTADLCFLTHDDVVSVREKLVAVGVKLVGLGTEQTENGIVERTGARGKLRSVYCRDPDNNLIEISNHVDPELQEQL
ncbi:Glyoxalase/Bleomycin resistance protein/Dihydroxybiphenyl dioxygenase [Glarea lozoyensis ATCC 20868]|uniref:Glyoxalase/Bleomycin resistance protein/Dihydroxybiphenyl dioxygenase n=1 Tax=Glarea lozoyensis (strain ATCC 20868 / MF5171) TaxID=1116229 RepID=S3D975_GLAL2|nr:Glyoxalase/Bleomycin resistance protein/Dihydroxybiphenyl dioxygenase [Glarea lozoyensis ATCC 20868]EPE35032.1 Glyoxalase/Bleomycin resistance protein/Dihydroxybiphenyl dioxygenase [Glarea lozoyensis ATCC 20868]